VPPDALPLVPLRAHSALALAVYGEELAQGARVAVFGDATLGVAEELIERGARLVHVYDSDPARVVEANARAHDRSIYFARLPEGGDAGVRDGAFDLVLVPDLSSCADHKAVLAVARRVLSAQGAAIIASPNPEASAKAPHTSAQGALGYYELYESVVAEFPAVRMLGQIPFVGYAVAEFAAVDPEPTIDNSLASEREPEWFVALASQRGVRLEPFALIELPAEAFDTPRLAALPANEPDDAAAARALAGGTVLVNILEAEREAALEALRTQEQQVAEERARANQAHSALLSLRDELALARERSAMLERELLASQAEKHTLHGQQDELEALRARVSALQSAARRTAEEHELLARATAGEREAKAQQSSAEQQERAELAQREQERREQHVVAERDALVARVKAEHDALVARLKAEQDVLVVRLKAEHEAKLRDALREQDVARARLSTDHEAASQQLIAEYEAKLRAAALAFEQRARESASEYERDVARFEAQLRELGREARALGAEVLRREKLVRELLITYVPNGVSAPASEAEGGHESSSSAPPPSTTTHDPSLSDGARRLVQMAAEAATREADLVAARWKIAQLERELGQRR
jgi:hypothetical protein